MKCGSLFFVVLLGTIAAVHIEAEFRAPRRYPFASAAAESPVEQLWQSRLNIRFPRGTSWNRGSASESHESNEESHHQSSGGRVRRSDGSLDVEGSASSNTDDNGDTSSSGNLDVQGSSSNGDTLSLTGSAESETNRNPNASGEDSLNVNGSGETGTGSGSGSLTGELNIGGSQRGGRGSDRNGSGRHGYSAHTSNESESDEFLDLSIGSDSEEDSYYNACNNSRRHRYDGITGPIRRIVDNIMRILNIGNDDDDDCYEDGSEDNSNRRGQGNSRNILSVNGHNVASIGNNTASSGGHLSINSSNNSLVSRILYGLLQLPFRLVLLLRYMVRVSIQVLLLPFNIIRRICSYMVQGFIHVSFN